MKLQDITESKKNEQPGTYAAVTFDKDTVAALEKFNKDNKIANPNKDWHTTLLYSRKHLPNYKPEKKYQRPYRGEPTKFEIWPSQNEKKNVLVLTFSCPQLYQRHHKLMLEHGATYDFDQYKPHVTLSYDAGDLDLSTLPKFTKKLVIIGEYSEDLDTD